MAEGLTDLSESWITHVPATDIALTPKREVDADVLRAVLKAVRGRRSLEIRYQSMNKSRPEPIWRRMSPHAFGFDGLRWHARAFCHLDGVFKDFLLPRMLDARTLFEPGALTEEDTLWHETFDVVVGPHPDLTRGQQAVVSKDYGLKGGRATLSVRYAMLFYVLKRLGLLGDPAAQDPRLQHIVVLNKRETDEALARNGLEPDQMGRRYSPPGADLPNRGAN